jgi:hypothetical protein
MLSPWLMEGPKVVTKDFSYALLIDDTAFKKRNSVTGSAVDAMECLVEVLDSAGPS